MAKNILVRPVVSEKAEMLASNENKFSFVVDKKANKLEVKKAVEAMFNVSVVDVNTLIIAGKTKVRQSKSRVMRGMKASYKKAIVKLKDGDTIDIYTPVSED
jgi:large subunit ribosomal protein L23